MVRKNMQLKDFYIMAESLMVKHGLREWRIKLDRATRRFGVTRFATREIGISKKLVLLNSEEKVRDTILHEIAHVLAGPDAGHGPKWKMLALSIGCDGRRTADPKMLNMVQPSFQGVCPGCGVTVKKFKRTRSACAKCCGGVFKKEFLFIWSRIKTV